MMQTEGGRVDEEHRVQTEHGYGEADCPGSLRLGGGVGRGCARHMRLEGKGDVAVHQWLLNGCEGRREGRGGGEVGSSTSDTTNSEGDGRQRHRMDSQTGRGGGQGGGQERVGNEARRDLDQGRTVKCSGDCRHLGREKKRKRSFGGALGLGKEK